MNFTFNNDLATTRTYADAPEFTKIDETNLGKLIAVDLAKLEEEQK